MHVIQSVAARLRQPANRYDRPDRERHMGKRDLRQVKRIMAVLLCAFIFIAFTPAPAFALESEGAEAAEEIETELAEAAADAVLEETPAEVPAEALSTGEETSTEEASKETAAAEEIELGTAGPGTVEPNTSLGDPDSLLEGYMDKQLKEELGTVPAQKSLKKKAAASKRRETLTSGGKVIYDGLKEFADSVASGSKASSIAAVDITDVFSDYFVSKTVDGTVYNVVTSQSLGISSAVYVKKTVNGVEYWTFSDEAKAKLYDFEKVLYALMADEPYAFYWYDKTEGVAYAVDGLRINRTGTTSDLYFVAGTRPHFTAWFTVSTDYSADGTGSYTVDTSKTGKAAEAVANAAKIITDNASATDLAKLTAYKNKICELTSYNNAAVINPDYPYGDPWQMIHVFDDDTTTNVVCEGYAKAFQYLCDHTDFADSSIECDSVSGIMRGGTGAGLHMWNILHMDDGENYLADVTNSDTGTIGSRGGLFLSPALAGGSVSSGYGYDTGTDGKADVTYIYDEETRSIFSDSELMMAESEYLAHEHVLKDISYEWSADGKTCTAHATCETGGETLTRKAVVTGEVKTPATCTEKGVTTYTATFRQDRLETQTIDIEDIPAHGHRYHAAVTRAASEGVTGLMTYTCSVCGDRYTRTIPAIYYPADLPVVKISKPKAGKGKMTVKWKKVSKKNQKKIQGIEIQVATDPGFTNIVRTAYAGKKKTSKAIKGLSRKTVYYVRIRAYNNAGGRHVSTWRSKSVKVK